MEDKFHFGDSVEVQGEEKDYILIGLTNTEAIVVYKNDSWSEGTFGYTIQHVPLDKIILANI